MNVGEHATVHGVREHMQMWDWCDVLQNWAQMGRIMSADRCIYAPSRMAVPYGRDAHSCMKKGKWCEVQQ